jgi:hypothetical protein
MPMEEREIMKRAFFIILISATLFTACSSPPPPPPPPPVQEPVQLPRLAILPFISGDVLADDIEETFAWRLANIPDIQKYYHIVPITPQIQKNIKQEQTYNSAFFAGEEAHANFVMVTFIKSIGYQWIFYIVIMDVESKELIAGDHRKFDYIDQIPQHFPAMVAKMMSVVSQKKAGTPKLAVDILKIPSIRNIKPDVAAVLTQLLANEIANNGKFRVFPRTDNIDAASVAYERERESPANSIISDSNYLTAADYVLSSKISSLTMPPTPPYDMLGEILYINTNRLIIGNHVTFDTIEDAPDYIPRLAKILSSLH